MLKTKTRKIVIFACLCAALALAVSTQSVTALMSAFYTTSRTTTLSTSTDFKCKEFEGGEGRCTCDYTILDDCKGMSTFCKNNGGSGEVECYPLIGMCDCKY